MEQRIDLLRMTRNQEVNMKNPYQGKGKRILTVCSAGLLRSPTAAQVLSEAYGFNCRPAGVSIEYALIPVSLALLFWADEYVFMEREHQAEIERIFAEKENIWKHKPVQILDIPDYFAYGDEELKRLILEKYVLGS